MNNWTGNNSRRSRATELNKSEINQNTLILDERRSLLRITWEAFAAEEHLKASLHPQRSTSLPWKIIAKYNKY